TRQTCGGCHPYDTIGLGWHFNSNDASVPAGKPGEPWVLVDEKTGTQLPISNRDWPGAWKPAQLGLKAWDMTKLFGRHMPGGDWAEVEEAEPDVEARWDISGRLEINCLGCHNVSPQQNQSDWVMQVARENFRWSATAAAALGVVDGMAARLPNSWDVIDGVNPDNAYAVPPSVDYSEALFDAKNRVFMDVRGSVPAERCNFCHSTADVNEGPVDEDRDVHLAAGLLCTDCHRNGVNHQIVRGDESAPKDPETATLSCKGCHYGDASAEGAYAMGGRLGAPRPAHKGLPVTHIETMTCTTCHSGMIPEDEAGRVRTSRANRLGIHGRALWDTDLPLIASPVFKKDEDGKLAPHHMFWPAFWADADGGAIKPLLPEVVAEAAGDILAPQTQVTRVLAALRSADDPKAKPVYVATGKKYVRFVETKLTASEYAGGNTGETFWGLMTGDKIDPVVLDALNWTVDVLLNPDQVLTDAQIVKALVQIAYANLAEGVPVYITGGKMYERVGQEDCKACNCAGAISVSDAPADQSAAKGLWADRKDDGIKPLDVEVLKTSFQEMIDAEIAVTQEKVAGVLTSLAGAVTGGEPVYLSGGKLYRKNAQGGLDASEAPAGAPQADAFWGVLKNDALDALVPAYVTEAIAADKITEKQVKLVLAALAEKGVKQPVYVCAGQVHKLSGDSLASSDDKAAEPYSWSFGHDVRPAQQALGVNGCTDCHADGSPLLFGKVEPGKPAQVGQASVLPMFKLEGYDETQLAGWNRSVWMRPVTVYGGWVLGALIALTLFHYGLLALEAILHALVAKGGKE
ncbi:MAG: hypothetical protein QG656_2333, partial [Candidatus Hydrogenedentes bacterium]|nr:hypothetical protein [Candidatus Hydrogenedentota bacterium]